VSGEDVKPEILAALSDAAAFALAEDAADLAASAAKATRSNSRTYSQRMQCQSHGKVLPQVM